MTAKSTSSVDNLDKLGNPSSRRTAVRTATAVVTTLGAAAVATTAVAAPADAAASYAVWNRVAACESSNNWHIDTGNGYYGGLQFSSSTWGAYGGHRYASEASGASRIEQIAVARRVLASQGPNAWPVCGPRAGLNSANGHATHAPLPADPGGFRANHRAKHRHHHGARAHHRRHHARHAATNHRHYRVRSGDTLSKIAQRHHMDWHRLYHLNRHRIANPNVLHVGQILLLP